MVGLAGNGSVVWAFLGIVLVNLVLSGDNAVAIGMAANGLRDDHRRYAIVAGVTIGSVLLGAFAIVFAVVLYDRTIVGLHLVGGLLLVWIAWKLLSEPPTETADGSSDATDSVLKAVGFIVLADVVMSFDNALAIASLSKGRLWLIALGVLLYIPLIVFGASIVTGLLDRFPWFVWIGGAIIVWVAGTLIEKSPLLAGDFHGFLVHWLFLFVAIAGTTGLGYWSRRRDDDRSAIPFGR